MTWRCRLLSGLSVVLVCWGVACFALSTPLPGFQAFQFHATYNENKMLVLNWDVAPNYHLYQSSISVQSTNPKVALGKFYYPDTQVFEGRPSYSGHLNLQIPVVLKPGARHIDVTVGYQGCSGAGYCYAPELKRVSIDLKTPGQVKMSVASQSQQGRIETLFSTHQVAWLLLIFFGLGVLLALTPCVLPMVPILSGIIVGHGKKTSAFHAFRLSCVYVLGMALSYAAAGLLIALAGAHVQEALQSPWVIVTFALVFCVLSLSLFGVYELRLPRWFEARVAGLSHRQAAGSYVGVFIMGVLSSLIVSPCVSAPLVGVLMAIAKTGDAVLGALTLFALGLGMGVPLLLVGTSVGHWLPRTGRWMTQVRSFFGVLLLGVAIALVSRVIPEFVAVLLWSALAIVCSVSMGALSPARAGWPRVYKGLSLLIFIYGVALMVGVLQGRDSLTRPLSLGPVTTQPASRFVSVTGVAALDRQLARAKRDQAPVLLDFSAKWCASCQVMAQTTFRDPTVLAALEGYHLVRVDLTAHDAASHQLRQRFHVVGTPTIMFVDSHGQWVRSLTNVGEMNAKALLAWLKSASVRVFSQGSA
jgi:thiol:disulfide interchange protein DsbD